MWSAIGGVGENNQTRVFFNFFKKADVMVALYVPCGIAFSESAGALGFAVMFGQRCLCYLTEGISWWLVYGFPV